ncbi:hypothetical protein GGR51DRAFT_520916 [Nemania sp. FL0031]|nr:hypothetical protein GGR51DRAFT_520916 [Nemania sp. FL0031]
MSRNPTSLISSFLAIPTVSFTSHMATSSLLLCFAKKCQTWLSIRNISKQVRLSAPLDTHFISRHQAGFITRPCFNRPFMSSPLSQSHNKQSTAAIGMEWYDLSAERKIQWLLNTGDAKWGWVVYRTCYKPEFDTAWDIVKSMTEEKARRRVAQSDAPDIASKMDWVFVEDRDTLENASRDELKRRFKDWARAENSGWDIDKEKYSYGSRYGFFIQVDEPALLSIATGSDAYPAGEGSNGGPYVKLVRAYDDAAATESLEDGEDWMKIHIGTLHLDFYVELDNNEAWYTFYTSPNSICSW